MNNIRKPSSSRDKNILTIPDRIGELAGIFFISLVAAFFAYHYINNTGFMTSGFGLTGAILLFGSAAMSIVASAARAAIGRRDKSRPFEFVSAVFGAVASVWFLSAFPFNFSHFSDPLPVFLKFIALWISNEIGWIIILLAAIGSFGTAIYSAVRMILDGLKKTLW